MGIGAQLARPASRSSSSSATAGSASAAWRSRRRSSIVCPSTPSSWNNSSWGPSFDQMPMLRGRVDPFDMLPDLRYDRMFEAIGCHGEHVEKPDEIRPALERAFSSGKASVVNVLGDPRVGHARLGGNLLGSTKV
jgi:acetolactate synthase-1/2/3 large subunit